MAAKYTGIIIKVKEDGTKNILVRFQYNGTRYPLKNFTKLYGCKTEKQAYDKLCEIKLLISQGLDPFTTNSITIDSIWKEWSKTKEDTKQWSKTTSYNSKLFYNAYLKEPIGNMKISKIKYAHIKNIIDSIKGENGTKNTVKRLLKPMFDDQVKKGTLSNNVLDKLVTLKEPQNRANLSLRTPEKPLEILRKLYNTIPKYNKSYKSLSIKAMMYMCLLTAHRTGELRQLKRKDINLDTMRVIAPAETTKTKIDYHYLLPSEIKTYVNALKPEDLVFPISRGSMNAIFNRWVKLAKVELFNDKLLSWHDFRRLMATVMVMECKVDSMLADACLEHSPEGVKKHYFHFTYENKCEAFQKFWDKIKEGIN